MDPRLTYEILPQPDETTCGPTCLHSVYRFYNEDLPLDQVIREVGMLQEGGTLAVFLGCHALRRRYNATLYTCDLRVFDPTWFRPLAPPLVERLQTQKQHKLKSKLQLASDAYIEFLNLGGVIRMEPPTRSLMRRYLKRDIPILTGLSATWLYGEARERLLDESAPVPKYVADDVGGYPQGHFVVLCDYDAEEREVLVADPYSANPLARDHMYHVDIDRVIGAILLGILTYDANLLIIEPKKSRAKSP